MIEDGVLQRQETFRRHDVEQQRRHDGREGHHQRRALMPQHPQQRPMIDLDHAVDAAADRASPGTSRSSPACLSSREHIIGVSVSETTAEVTTAMVSVSANSRNMRPTSPDMNSSGMNTAISDTVSEITVKPISLRAAQRGFHRAFAILHMANDVLDHHDGVVDHEAGADGQRHQRQVVETEAGEIHDRRSW